MISRTDFPYRMVVVPRQESAGGGFLAYYPTLGLHTMSGFGDTVAEAIDQLYSLRDLVFEIWREDEDAIPQPSFSEFEIPDLSDAGMSSPCIFESDFDYAA